MRFLNRHTILIVFLSLLMLSFIVGCSHKEKAPKDAEIKEMVLSANDTTSVCELSDQFMTLLQNKKYDEAVDMLYFLKGGYDLVKLSDEDQATQKNALMLLPVLRYKLTSITFVSEEDSQVRYDFEFFEKEEGDDRPNTTALFLKPVRRDGRWYLTLYDTQTHEGKPSEIRN